MPTRNTSPEIPIVRWTPSKKSKVVQRFLERPVTDDAAEATAREILDAVRRDGDAAVLKYALAFDGAKLTADRLRVAPVDLVAARRAVDRDFKRAAEAVHARIVRFAQAGMRKDWYITSPKGGQLGEQFSPLDRVGVYIPGAAAPLASTALMTVTLAKVAGVPEIVACTPSGKQADVNPYILHALELAGATEIYRVGGVQAIGAMAYGTTTIRKVQKIVGPGGPHVTAAKRLVYGIVDLDLVAGPSEIAVFADESASPRHVAADLLAQAEHGTGREKALLVTESARFAEAVKLELLEQAQSLPRRELVRAVMEQGMLLVVVNNMDTGMDLINLFAPEHLELLVREPRTWVRKVKAAGAIFVGPWSPECAGDFAAGPSHVLPTGGTARIFSGLTVDHFRKRSSIIAFTQADLKETLPIIQAFARVEQLEAHGRSAAVRFER